MAKVPITDQQMMDIGGEEASLHVWGDLALTALGKHDIGAGAGQISVYQRVLPWLSLARAKPANFLQPTQWHPESQPCEGTASKQDMIAGISFEGPGPDSQFPVQQLFAIAAPCKILQFCGMRSANILVVFESISIAAASLQDQW